MFMWYVSLYLAALLAVLCSGQDADRSYPWKDAQTGEAITCGQCPPGTFVGSHCTKQRPTECLPCAQSHYTEFYNYVEECLMCNYPCTEVQEEVHGCNATHNRVCRCKEGYYSMFDFCLRHTVCPAGEGVKTAGTRERNVECEPCKNGTFSRVSSSSASCQPHKVCATHQATIPGDSVYDTFCSLCKANSTDPQDKKVCVEEAVRLVLDRVQSGKQTQRLQRVLRNANRAGSKDLGLKELMDVLVIKEGSTDLEALLNVLERARVFHCYDTISAWLQ
ncbi:hypothetical protein ACEWY4_000126 [Coilia grayii]|uniref:TNFR-Cys domain-containing protein n=1 Tax=Coilia grayii TaxID=363190 RepID=A0ABD1KVR4_9TELE